jgi:chromosome segregation ATPase
MSDTEIKRKDSIGSSSSKGGDKLDGKAKDVEVLELQKKLKKLKDALIKERFDKETAIKGQSQLHEELEKYKLTLQEKESIILNIKTENSDLRERLTLERKKTENSKNNLQNTKTGGEDTGVANILGGMFGFKPKGTDELSKLQSEHSYVKKQLETVLEKLNKSDGQVEKIKKDNRQQLEKLEKKIQDLEAEIEDKSQRMKTVSSENDKLLVEKADLMRDKNKLEDELRKIKRETELLRHDKEDLEKSNSDKLKLVDDLNGICKKMEEEIKRQSEETKKAKEELLESEMKLQVFSMKKLGKMVDTPAQLLIRKNVADEYVIEIEHSGERLSISPSAVVSFGPVEKYENQFFIQFKSSANNVIEKESFEADDSKKILRYLKVFMKSLKNGDSGTKKEKNLFSQVASFFGS